MFCNANHPESRKQSFEVLFVRQIDMYSDAEDWWKAASTRPPAGKPPISSAAPTGALQPLGSVGRDAPPSRSGIASTAVPTSLAGAAPGSDPVLSGLRGARPSRKNTRKPSPGAGNAVSSSQKRRVLAGSPRGQIVSKTVLRELVEQATGLGRATGDPGARETALLWLRGGRAEAVDVFRTVVAGPAPADAPFNIRVLAFVHWIVVLGGPPALAAACESSSPRRPSPALRVCLDVLKACGHTSYSPSVFEGARERISSWTLDAPASTAAGKSYSGMGPNPLVSALEMYAILLGRKLAFHALFPEVEANYSLDRFYRQLYVENSADPDHSARNTSRHGEVISRTMGVECALLARGSATVAAALDRAKVPIDIVGIVFTNACNSYALARYVLGKVISSSPAGSAEQRAAEQAQQDLLPIREWLARRIKTMESRAGDGARVLRRFVERSVLHAIEDPGHRAVRPESRHRREVPCVFSSFAGMHSALAPTVRL